MFLMTYSGSTMPEHRSLTFDGREAVSSYYIHQQKVHFLVFTIGCECVTNGHDEVSSAVDCLVFVVGIILQ